MDKKHFPFIPTDSLKQQRVDVYIKDLQKRLHQLRQKHDTIFVECCDLLKQIHQVSSHTIMKQQEIGKIITEFEDIGTKNNENDEKKALIQKVGDVKRLREKFENIFQDNLNDLIVRTKKSLESVDTICVKMATDTQSLNQYSLTTKPKPSTEATTSTDTEDLWQNVDSFYSLANTPSQDDGVPKQ